MKYRTKKEITHQREQILALIKAGKSVPEVASLLRRKQSTIYSILWRANNKKAA